MEGKDAAGDGSVSYPEQEGHLSLHLCPCVSLSFSFCHSQQVSRKVLWIYFVIYFPEFTIKAIIYCCHDDFYYLCSAPPAIIAIFFPLSLSFLIFFSLLRARMQTQSVPLSRCQLNNTDIWDSLRFTDENMWRNVALWRLCCCTSSRLHLM